MNLPTSTLAGGENLRDTGAHPAHPLFWARRGAGHDLLMTAALLHLVVGGVAAASCLALWYRAGAATRYPLELALMGATVAVAGLLVMLLALPQAALPALIARALLPIVDLGAAVGAYWVLGAANVVLPLFLLPAAVACVLLSWRGGVVIAALAQIGYCTLAALRMGTSLDAWVPETLLLAGLLIVQTGSLGIYAGRMQKVAAVLQTRLGTLRRDRAAQAAEQERLLDGLTLMEEAQARLEHERVQVNAQIVALASAAQLLAEGDPSGVRALTPGMYGPLDLLAGALGRLAMRSETARPLALEVSAITAISPQVEATRDALREQARLLASAEALLRDLGARASELVVTAQAVRQEALTPQGDDSNALAATLSEIERLAREQYAGATTLSSRLAQVLERQDDLGAVLNQAPPSPAALAESNISPLWSAHGVGTSSPRHVSVWDPSPSGSRAASRPLR
jgi:hypothetical protein